MSVDRTEVLVSQDVTEVLVPAEVTEVLVPTGNVVIVSASGPGGGGPGTTDHRDLTHRGDADQHPTAAITGLDAALGALTAADAAEATARTNADAAEAIARNSAISTAIANLINSAPGALDTLNELATALGNDPNFATTITNLLAGKQPLDSDLTAIAALATTAFGRSVLTQADAAAIRGLLTLGTAAVANIGSAPGTVAAGDDRRFNRVSAMTWYGHSWLAFGGGGGSQRGRISEGMVARFSSMLSVPPEEIDNRGRSGAMLCRETAMPNGDWPAILQLQVPPTNIAPGFAGSGVGAPYTARPALLGLVYGLNDVLIDPFGFAASRTLYRAWPHAMRTALALSRAGGIFDSADASNGYSGFGTTVASGVSLGSQYRQSATNGDTVTHTIRPDFPGGTVTFLFLAAKDVRTTLTAGISAGATSIPVAAGTYITNGDLIDLSGGAGTDVVRVTGGGGTTTLTTTACAANHSSGASVCGADTSNVAWSGTAAIGSPAATPLSAQGANQRVPVVKRFTGLTAADAGKTIVATTAGMVAGSNDVIQFAGVIYEAQVAPPVLVQTVPKYPYASIWTFNTDPAVTSLNALTAGVVAEFDHAAIVDLAARWNARIATLGASMNATDTTTTVAVTMGATPYVVGSIVRASDPGRTTVEDMLITAISGANVTFLRGANGTTRTTHASGDLLYAREMFSADNVHPSTVGDRDAAIAMRDTLAALPLSADQIGEANGSRMVNPRPIRTGGPLVPAGPRGRLQPPTNGKASYVGLVVPRPIVVTRLGCWVLTAGSAGSVVRLGLMSDGGAAYPNRRIVDAGTIDATIIGYRTIALDGQSSRPGRQILLPGVYWTVASPQGAPATQPVLASVLQLSETPHLMPPVADASGTFYGSGLLRNTVTGTLANQTAAQTLPHGLAVAPADWQIDFDLTAVPTRAGRVFFDSADATNVTIHTDAAMGTPGYRMVIDATDSPAEFAKSGYVVTGQTGALGDNVSTAVLAAGEGILVAIEYETVEVL